jgi:hypothetical protein
MRIITKGWQMSKDKKKHNDEKTELSFKMKNKNAGDQQVTLSLSLDSKTKKMLEDFSIRNKISESLQARWIIMKKYKNWDLFAAASLANFRSMNMEAAKLITDYFSPID